MNRCRMLCLLPCLLLLGACSAALKSRPVVEFPSSESLNQLAAQPTKPLPIAAAPVPAAGWTVEAAHTAQRTDDAWQPDGVFARGFVATAAKLPRPPRLTRALSCIAEQLGRFYLETNKEPPQGLSEFISGACGAALPSYGTHAFFGHVPPAADESEILTHFQDKVSALVQQLPPQAEAGFWYGRKGDQIIAMATSGEARHELQPFSLIPDETGRITIEGRVAQEVDHFAGYINQGRYGVEECLVDPSVQRPKFRITCAMAEGDRTAWLQLVYVQPRRALSTPMVQALLRRTPDETLSYELHSTESTSPIVDAESFSRAVLTALNAVRAEAQLKPVIRAEAQSNTATRVVGHYFVAASEAGREAEMDRIALGLLAGWQVPGMIRDGNFYSKLVPYTRDPNLWLRAALATPMGRSTLLAENIEQIAIGPLMMSSPEAVGAVVTGYRFHHGNDHRTDVLRLFLRLGYARQRLALGPLAKLSGMNAAMNEALARVHRSEVEPKEALDEVLTHAVSQTGASMRGYIVETTSLDGLEIPPELIGQPNLQLSIGVTHHKPQGAAWAQLVIMVVFVATPTNEV